MLVISPFKSLMNDQVEFLGTVGIPAIAVEDVDDPDSWDRITDYKRVLHTCVLLARGYAVDCNLERHS